MVVVVLGEMMVVNPAASMWTWLSLPGIIGLRARGLSTSQAVMCLGNASRLFCSSAVFYEVGLLTPRPTHNLEGQGAVLSDPSPTDLPRHG